MRIVAGKFRGARIEAPKGLATRPTSDRVRQALFNVLDAWRAALSTSKACACSTSSPARARSGSRPCRAAHVSALFIEESAEARGCHPPQCRGAGSDRRDQDLAARCDEARRSGHASALRPRLLRSALRQGIGRARARGGLPKADGSRPARLRFSRNAPSRTIAWPAPFQEIDRRRYGDTRSPSRGPAVKGFSPLIRGRSRICALMAGKRPTGP